MTGADFEIEEAQGGAATLRLKGDWTTTGVGRMSDRLNADLGGREIAALDVSELGRFDTAGALALAQASKGGVPDGAWDQRPEAGRIYKMVEKLERTSTKKPREADPFTRTFAKVGRGVYDIGAETILSFAFLGRLMTAVVAALKHPGRIRWPAWVSQAERAGLDAMPIVVVTNFFIGAVIAFIGADLLTDFGAGVFAVQLIGVAVFREFAVVITAVLLAGRSASAFAAEIGSMRMNQEVDAMQVMGVNPFQALVVPRLAALVVMLPLLTFLGMLGGLFGGLGLDLTRCSDGGGDGVAALVHHAAQAWGEDLGHQEKQNGEQDQQIGDLSGPVFERELGQAAFAVSGDLGGGVVGHVPGFGRVFDGLFHRQDRRRG